MVTYKRIYADHVTVTYAYYPEDDTTSDPGIIYINLPQNAMYLARPASADYKVRHRTEEVLKIRNNMNAYFQSIGRAPYSEKKYPLPKQDTVSEYFYAHMVGYHIWDCAIQRTGLPGKGQIGE